MIGAWISFFNLPPEIVDSATELVEVLLKRNTKVKFKIPYLDFGLVHLDNVNWAAIFVDSDDRSVLNLWHRDVGRIAIDGGNIGSQLNWVTVEITQALLLVRSIVTFLRICADRLPVDKSELSAKNKNIRADL